MQLNTLERMFMKNAMLKAPNRPLSVKIDKDLAFAANQAYLSMQPRTFKSIKSNKQQKHTIKRKSLIDLICKKFVKYFLTPAPKTQCEFDGWHNNACNNILDALNKLLVNNDYESVSYGKAQKIVNVMFKLVYLYDDVEGKEDYFRFCHYIIDDYNLIFARNQADCKYNSVWSKMKSTDYWHIQKAMRDWLKKQSTYNNLFEAEFYIWANRFKEIL